MVDDMVDMINNFHADEGDIGVANITFITLMTKKDGIKCR